MKSLVGKWSNVTRQPLDYSIETHPISIICDASFTGAAGILCQGPEWQKVSVAAFWSGKFTTTQQNYPIMLHFCNIKYSYLSYLFCKEKTTSQNRCKERDNCYLIPKDWLLIVQSRVCLDSKSKFNGTI